MKRRLARWGAPVAIFSCVCIASLSALAQLLPPPPLPTGSLVVTISSPSSGATVSGTVQVNASVSIVGSLTVANVDFFVDGNFIGNDSTAPYSASWNTRKVGNGSHTLTAIARDLLGVRYSSNPVNVTVFNDTTAPSISITSPANGATVSGTINVSADASDNIGVAGAQFRLDGVPLGAEDTAAPYTVSWNTTTTSDGSHTLTAVARDAAGNTTASAAVSVTVSNAPAPDTTPPSVAITAPPDGATVSGEIIVSADAADNSGVAGVQFRVDGVALGAEDTTAPYSIAWDTATVPDGSYTLTAVAKDSAGNSTTSVGVSVTVSNASASVTRLEETAATFSGTGWTLRGAETASFSAGAAGTSNIAGDSVVFTFTGTAVSWIGLRCSVCGIATVSIDGGPASTVDTAGATAPGSPGLTSGVVFAASGLPEGTHTLTITVTGKTTSSDAHIAIDAFDVTGTAGGPTPTRIEDSDPAVTYAPAGDWVFLTDSRATGGTAVESQVAGATATLVFTGTEVRWIGYHFSGGGIARVSIDGVLLGEVDQYAPTESLQAVTFAATGLARGAHTLTIEVTGTKRPESLNTWVLIDAFDVTP